MAGLLDLLASGLLGPTYNPMTDVNPPPYAQPVYPMQGMGGQTIDMSARSRTPAQAAAPLPQQFQPQQTAQTDPRGIPVEGGGLRTIANGFNSGTLFGAISGLSDAAAGRYSDPQSIAQATMMANYKALMANGVPEPQARMMAINGALQNPKVQESLFGAPTNMGSMKLPNGAEIPAYSIHGNAPVYNVPPQFAGQLNAPTKLGDTKIGDISTPTLYQNGQVTAPLPGGNGMQGAIDLNNSMTRQKAAAEAEGKTQGTNAANLPNTVGIADQFLKQIDEVRNDPNIGQAIGAIAGRAPAIGGHQADLINRISQLQNQTMLQGFQQLRGAGRITQAEMFRAGDAIARLNRVGTVEGFKKALDDLHDVVVSARTRAGVVSGVGPTPPEQPKAAAPSFTQDQLRAEAIRRGLIKQ